jgi:hypothetical protein
MELFISAALQSAASLRAEREAIQELQLAPGLPRRLHLLATTPFAQYDSKPGMLYLPESLAGWEKFTAASLAAGALSCVMVFS